MRLKAPGERDKQEPRVMWRTSKNEARAGYRRSVEPITPLEKRLVLRCNIDGIVKKSTAP
jgi:hypothetical protein